MINRLFMIMNSGDFEKFRNDFEFFRNSDALLFSFFASMYIDLLPELKRMVQYFLVITQRICSCGKLLMIDRVPFCFMGCSISPKCDSCNKPLGYTSRISLRTTKCLQCIDLMYYKPIIDDTHVVTLPNRFEIKYPIAPSIWHLEPSKVVELNESVMLPNAKLMVQLIWRVEPRKVVELNESFVFLTTKSSKTKTNHQVKTSIYCKDRTPSKTKFTCYQAKKPSRRRR